jgi:hypothetical protein
MKSVLLALLSLATASVAAAHPARMGATWSPVYGLPPAKAGTFMPALRALGGGFSRVTLYWTQLEPHPGTMRWDELDAYLDQIERPDEAMITIASASPWATRVKAAVFPSSPAKDPKAYYSFVRAVVEHCAGRVRYFQADTEPSNRFYWDASAADYAAQQRIFYRAVKDADPRALVVLGGSDGLFDPAGDDPLPQQDATIAYLRTILRDTGNAYDLFDLHLYADPYTIPARVAFVRAEMRAAGHIRPIIASEVSGPGFFEFKANRRFAAALIGPGAGPDTVRQLKRSLADMPIAARMFLDAPGSAAAGRLLRVQSEDLVIRNVLALAAGIERTAWFAIPQDAADPDAPRSIINSPTGLFASTPQGIGAATPLAAVFARTAHALDAATSVTRIATDDDGVYAYRIAQRGRPALLLAWRRTPDRATPLAPVETLLPWRARSCAAIGVDGSATQPICKAGRVSLALTDMPALLGVTAEAVAQK